MTRKLLGLLQALFIVLAVLAVAAAHWFEVLTGLDPDAGSGLLEYLIAAAFLALAITCHWLRTRRAATA
jgi:hypothetical protein